jgi:hypothetical protein
MPELWFFLGVAVGTLVTGFCAIGSFKRGSDSVRRVSWRLEHSARRRALVAPREVVRVVQEPAPDRVLPSGSQPELAVPELAVPELAVPELAVPERAAPLPAAVTG